MLSSNIGSNLIASFTSRRFCPFFSFQRLSLTSKHAISLPSHAQMFIIAICYEGGLDANGKPADTRTEAQNITLEELLKSLCTDYPDAEILGHRDLPGVRKECPCFDTKKWLEDIKFHI